MASTSKIAANRRNSLKSCGPRGAAGKSVASLRHGLAALTYRKVVPAVEIEQFSRALCGNDSGPLIFAQAVKIAENELLLEAIWKQQVTAVEAARRTAVAFASKGNSFEVAKLCSLEFKRAEQKIKERLPQLFAKYKDKILALMDRDGAVSANSYEQIMDGLTDGIFSEADILRFILEGLVSETKPVDNQILGLARKQIEAGQRDEFEALQAAIRDLTGSIATKAGRGHGKSGRSVNLSGLDGGKGSSSHFGCRGACLIIHLMLVGLAE